MELQKVVEKRPVLFLFESYWPLLKFFQIIGCFPFAKTTKDNCIGLKPLNAVLVITLYSLSWIIVVSAVIGIYFLLPNGFQWDQRFSESETKSFTDWLAQITRSAILVGLHLILLVLSLQYRTKLCQLQDFFQTNFQLKQGSTKHLMKSDIVGISGYIILVTIASILVTIGSAYEFNPELSWYEVLLWLITSIFMLYLQCPVAALTAVIIEVSSALKSWINCLKHEDKISFRDCLKLNQALKMATDLFSWALFFITIDSIILFVLFSYKTLSSFKDSNMYVVPLGFFAYGMLLCDVIFNTNIASQRVVDELEGLKQKIVDLTIDDPETMIALEDQMYSFSYARQKVLHDLGKFQGYTGGGYFTLGKSLLSTLISNFVTYLIILIQFKLSESPNDTNFQHCNCTDK